MSSATLVAPYPLRKPRMWLLHDEPSRDRAATIEFHVEGGDYFPTLSTILALLEDSLEDSKKYGLTPSQFQIRTLRDLKDELLHVHRLYTIIKR